MSKSSSVPDAWDDDWETAADKAPTPPSQAVPESKKVSSRVTKAQRRAQQAEFNRQLWADAEGAKETNYFLETRANGQVPLRSEFKPAPILLSRKVPSSKKTGAKNPLSPDGSANGNGPGGGGDDGDAGDDDGSSEEDDAANGKKTLTLAERQAQAARDREVKQRKYEERRQQLFGVASSSSINTNAVNHSGNLSAAAIAAGSGTSSPGNITPTPPSSRSATPNRGGGVRSGGRGKGYRKGGAATQLPYSITKTPREVRGEKELYDPSYTPKPDSIYIQQQQRRSPGTEPKSSQDQQQPPSRAPRGPDGSGRGGFGFLPRGGQGGGGGGEIDVTSAPPQRP